MAATAAVLDVVGAVVLICDDDDECDAALEPPLPALKLLLTRPELTLATPLAVAKRLADTVVVVADVDDDDDAVLLSASAVDRLRAFSKATS